MLNLLDLEKRWLRYKIKSYLPYATIAISLIIITILASIILNSQANNEEIITEKITPNAQIVTATSIDKKIEQKSVLVPKKTIQTQRIAIVTDKSESTKLQPSFSFMQDMQNSSLPYYQQSSYKKSKEVHKKKKKIAPQTTIIEKKEIVKIKPEVLPRKKIIITRKETRDDIKNVIKRFKVSNNPALSLFVAKKYYEIKNYRQSYNYALITNQINKEIESSWIIFIKSLVKLGKKGKAVATLKEYIKASDSNTARLLLEEIQAGKFQ